jgi:hypothetical protein
MKKLLIPFLFISVVVGFMACHKEVSSDPTAKDKVMGMLSLKDSSYTDTTRHDTTRTDTSRTDTCHKGCGVIRDTLVALTGDQIHLTPLKIDSGSLSGLAIAAITANDYPCLNNFLVSGLTNSGGDYTLNFSGVNIPRYCSGGQTKARSTKVLYPVQDGTHVFKVLLNGITYTGSFVKTGNQYTFTWPYTSGVTISPLTIN